MAIVSKSLLVSLGAMAGTINAMSTNLTNGTERDSTKWSFNGAEGWGSVQLFFDHEGPVEGVAFMGNQSFVSVSKDETMRKYTQEGETFEFAERYSDHADFITRIAVGGDYVATAGDDGSIYIRGGTCSPCELEAADVKSLFFNKDGSRLMAASGPEVKVWDASSQFSALDSVVPGEGAIASAALSGSSLATSSGTKLVFSDAESGGMTQELTTVCELKSLAFSADGTSIAGACNNMIYVFKKDETFQLAGSVTINTAMCLAWSPSGAHLAAGNMAGDVSVWRAANWSATPQTMTCSYGVLSLEFSSEDDLLLAGDNGGGVSLLKPPKAAPKAALVAKGSVSLEVQNASVFCQDPASTQGFVKALATTMELDEQDIEAECKPPAARRLRDSPARKLAETVTFEYTISLDVGGALNREDALTKLEAATVKLEQANMTAFAGDIVNEIQVAGGSEYAVIVTEITKSELFDKSGDKKLTPIEKTTTEAVTSTADATTTAAAANTTAADDSTTDEDTTTELLPRGRADDSAAISSRHFAMAVMAAAVLMPIV